MYNQVPKFSFILSSLIHCLSCQAQLPKPQLPTFNATSPVKAYPPCGLKDNGKDFWNMSGKMTIPDKTAFGNKITILSEGLRLCTIHLDQCPPPVVLTQGKVCYCSEVNKKEDVYHFVIRLIADPSFSEKNLSAIYSSSLSLTNGITTTQTIGKLPVMFGQASARYVLAGCYGKPSCTRGKQFTDPSDTISVMPRQFVMLQFMVDNLVNGSITVDGVVSPYTYTRPNPIIDTKNAGTKTQVKVTYTEAGGCKRTGGFTLNIVAVSDPSSLDCVNELD